MRKISLLAALLAVVAFASCKDPNQNANKNSSAPPPASKARWVAKFRSQHSTSRPGITLATFSYSSISVVSPTVIFAAGDMPDPDHFEDKRIGVVVRTTDGGQSWKETIIRPSDVGIPTLNSLHFVNPGTGWVVGVDSGGTGVVLKTTDGGETWAISKLRFDQVPVTVFFADEQTGWMGGSTPYPGQEDGQGGPSDILFTTDGGKTWDSQRRVPVSIEDIFFLDRNTGWAAGYKGVIYHTTDGGRTWDAQKSEIEPDRNLPDLPDFEGLRFTIHGIHFFDPQNGFAAAANEERNAGRALGTSNGGDAWARKWIVNDAGVADVVMISPGEAWAIVQKGRYVYRTVDAGRTWLAEPVEFEQEAPLHRLGAFASSVWAAGGGAIFKREE
jgi:photosystem II stability/assembly factor-like uncharacterized protein